MSDWQDGEVRQVQGSGAKPYKLLRRGEVYSCSCPAWTRQSKPIDQRTCKHLIAQRGRAVEESRISSGAPATSPVTMPARGQEDPEEVVRQVMGVSAPARVPQAQESTVPCQDGGIERDKTKRVNRFGGFQPFTDQEKTIIYAEEEARLGRKLRQDEKTNLFGPPVLLANSVEDDFDPTGWLESEKLDGVRAYWSGVQFISRQGNVYEAPDFFVAELPQVPLDGELWMGRKQFQKTISVVRSAGSGQAWDKVSFVVFDAPNRTEGFEQRLTYLAGLELGHFAHVHPHSPCKSRAEAEAHLKQATADGAEGLMYRKPGSSYEPRRSSTLMKFKPFKDAEAVVIRHVAGKGRHKGRLGGLEVRMADGKTFNVGTGLTDRERDNPPKVGATITYRFADTTSDGIPKCASFVAVRDYE